MNGENNTHPINQLAAVEFVGADAASFLQGQLTINSETLQAGAWRRAAYCSRQGRIITCGILCRLAADDGEQRFLWIVAADSADDVTTQLRRFILRAKVRTAILSAAFFGGSGKTPAAAAGDVVVDGDTLSLDDGLRVTLNAAGNNADGDNQAWARTEIKRAVPWISAKTRELFIPQFVNFELLGGVNFDKGCYVGQEVIARLHHLGQVKRRGVILAGAAAPPPPGTVVSDSDGNNAGEIVNSASDGDGFIALASVKLSRMTTPLFVGDSAVKPTPPPYPLA